NWCSRAGRKRCTRKRKPLKTLGRRKRQKCNDPRFSAGSFQTTNLGVRGSNPFGRATSPPCGRRCGTPRLLACFPNKSSEGRAVFGRRKRAAAEAAQETLEDARERAAARGGPLDSTDDCAGGSDEA